MKRFIWVPVLLACSTTAMEDAASAQAKCDPAIHDVLQARFRTPTECEVQLDLKIRQTLAAAFAGVKELRDWMVDSETEVTAPARSNRKPCWL